MASPYCFRFKAAFRSWSISNRHPGHRKVLTDRGIPGAIYPYPEHVLLEGKWVGATIILDPYHSALDSSMRRKMPHSTSGAWRARYPFARPLTFGSSCTMDRLGSRQPGAELVQKVVAEVPDPPVEPGQDSLPQDGPSG